MLESRRDMVKVLTQLVAVSHAVNSTGFVILASGLRQCTDAYRACEDRATVARLEKLFLSLAETGTIESRRPTWLPWH